MRAATALLLPLAVGSCRGPDFQEQLSAVVRYYQPVIENVMGHEAQDFEVHVGSTDRFKKKYGGSPVRCRALFATLEGPGESKNVMIFDPSIENLGPDGVLAIAVHETVHACTVEEWETLPRPLEEGLCDAIALSLSPRAWPAMKRDQGRERRGWMEYVQRAGVPHVHELALRAHREGLGEIPAEWLDLN